MTTTSAKALIAACALTLWPLCTTGGVCAQARIELIPTTEIPHSGYGSWSLFLVCNPAWIIENGDAGVVSFSIKTGVFNAEIEHSTDSAHADQRC